MPASYQIDAARRLITSRYSGELTDHELRRHVEAMAADPDFDPLYSLLADLTGVTTLKLTTGGVRWAADHDPLSPCSRRALVVRGDLGFGMARMFQNLASHASENILVARTLDEARHWLEAA